jgi:hypothetical protein
MQRHRDDDVHISSSECPDQVISGLSYPRVTSACPKGNGFTAKIAQLLFGIGSDVSGSEVPWCLDRGERA